MTKNEALKRSLEQLEFFDRSSHQHGYVWQKHLITAIKAALAQPEQDQFKPDWNTEAVLVEEMQRMAKRIEELEALAQPEHPEQMARLGWQYVECPACGSEGARAFPKPEQEPVAWLQIGVGPLHEGDVIARTTKPKEWNPEWWKFEPLYTSPPQRQPLTEEQLDVLALDDDGLPNSHLEFARAIEAAHGIGDKT